MTCGQSRAASGQCRKVHRQSSPTAKIRKRLRAPFPLRKKSGTWSSIASVLPPRMRVRTCGFFATAPGISFSFQPTSSSIHSSASFLRAKKRRVTPRPATATTSGSANWNFLTAIPRRCNGLFCGRATFTALARSWDVCRHMGATRSCWRGCRRMSRCNWWAAGIFCNSRFSLRIWPLWFCHAPASRVLLDRSSWLQVRR